MDKRLSDEERESKDSPIKKDEILKALKDMENNKSPGTDGLPKEFYVTLWKELGDDLSDIIAKIYLADQIPSSWKEGLITLIYKEKGKVEDIKNWRPISLLNTDYKLLTKVVANRMRFFYNDIVI